MAGMERIEHVVLVMMENRSYDHYFGALTLEGRDDLDGIRPGPAWINPSLEGPDYVFLRMDDPEAPVFGRFRDPPHEHDDVLKQVADGAMSGFVQAYEQFYRKKKYKAEGARRAQHVMGYLTRTTLPVSYYLADNFAVCDRWFSSFAGSTWPNRVYSLAGDADQLVGTGADWIPRWNAFRYPDPPFVRSWVGMERSWKAYSARPEQDSVFALWRIGPVYRGGRGGSLDDFARDCQSGSLPRFSIVEPDYAISDDHPPHDPMRGQQFLARVVKALLAAETTWSRSLLIITYDEHGGFFDHVAPPRAPENRAAPHHMLGARVPTLVISPYTPPRTAVHNLLDHTSVLKTIAERWGYSVPGPRGSSAAIHSLWQTPVFDWSMPPRSGAEILKGLVEPGYDLAARDILATATSEPTDLERHLRSLNILRQMEQLL